MSLTQASYTAIKRGLTALFKMGFDAAEPFYPTVSTVRPSTGFDEGYAKLGSMPGVREWLGERHFKELSAADWTLQNKLWELSIALEKTAFEDDRVGMFSDVMQDLGQEMAYHPDELRLQVMVDGATSECWDGQFFYDTDHAWRDSGTQSNIYTASGTATPTDPTVTEFRDAIEGAVDRMLSFKKDNGKPWIRPIVGKLNNLLVEVPLSMRTNAHKAYEDVLSRQGGGGSATDTIVDVPRIVSAPQLGTNGGLGGNDAHCYVHWIGSNMKPFLFQQRWANYRTSMKGQEDDEARSLKFMGTNRLNIGYFMWMYSVKVQFTA